ncbi:MAG TPA: hypothetical protein VMH87_01745 [Pseudomonadales bacterium]|nr:hypothetical protein [Pseudomonadales bacterium]
MSKKNIFLISFVVVLAGIYLVFFTHWFQPRVMQISHTSRPEGGRDSVRMTFGLGDYYELTDVKVVPLDEFKKNPDTPCLWHLVSDDGSDSINMFSYGENIGGMDPAVAGSEPAPLQSGVRYRLLVTAGRLKAQHDFYFGTPPANASNN